MVPDSLIGSEEHVCLCQSVGIGLQVLLQKQEERRRLAEANAHRRERNDDDNRCSQGEFLQSVWQKRERRQFDPQDAPRNRGIIYKLFSAYFLKDLINIHATGQK